MNDLIVSDKGDCSNSSWLEGKIYFMLEASFLKWTTLPIDICFFIAAFIMKYDLMPDKVKTLLQQ